MEPNYFIEENFLKLINVDPKQTTKEGLSLPEILNKFLKSELDRYSAFIVINKKHQIDGVFLNKYRAEEYVKILNKGIEGESSAYIYTTDFIP